MAKAVVGSSSASLLYQQIAVACSCVALILSTISVLVAFSAFRSTRMATENTGLFDFVKRYNEYASAMKNAVSVNDQHLSICALLDFLEVAAYLHNRKRVGSAYRHNIRATLSTVIPGYGGLVGFEAILAAYGPGPDTYPELRRFAREHKVLVSRQATAFGGTILDEISPLRRAA